MDTVMKEFIQCKRIAVVGVSRDPKKFGTAIFKELVARGYEVYGVNPAMQEVEGSPCYPNLTALAQKVDGVVICVKPERATDVVREAGEVGIKHIWLQDGSQSPEAIREANHQGVTPVIGKCVLMYAQPVQGFHKFHRFFAQLFGQL